MTRVRDIGRVELGALDYGANGYKDHVRSVPILIYRQPGSNELTTAREIRKTMADSGLRPHSDTASTTVAGSAL